MSAIGQLIGYAIGSIDIISIFGTTFGNTQFKQMTLIAGLSLIFSVAVTSYSVRERVLVSARLVAYVSFSHMCVLNGISRGSGGKSGAIQVLSQLFRTALDLPPRIQAICWAQFWAWIGMIDDELLTWH